VADNATAAGRQQNRRVELVVSGEEIGSAAPSQ
jgi:flagellar motor protein MotB